MKKNKAARRQRDLQRLKELERELLPQPRMKELMQACKRVGIKPERALAWVVNFCRWDLEQFSAGDWANLIYEVVWFGIYGQALPQRWDVPSGDDLQESILNPNRPLPTHRMILDLQQWGKARLQEFIANGETVISLQPKSVLVVKRDRKTARAEMMLKTDDLRQGFAFSFAQTLRLAGARLNQCPQCQKYYSARANQTYCSPRCQNRVSLQKFRAKPQSASQPAKKKAPRKKKSKRLVVNMARKK
jgi:hypothetical protein